nr:putative holin-like toxin [Bacillus sp. Ru63]
MLMLAFGSFVIALLTYK